jgi:hypothetical protein
MTRPSLIQRLTDDELEALAERTALREVARELRKRGRDR